MSRLFCVALLSCASLLIGCGKNVAIPVPVLSAVPPSVGSTPIQHIIIVMQENRSFDNLFNGFPGADTVASGMSNGVVVPLQPETLEAGHDVDHTHADLVQGVPQRKDGWFRTTERPYRSQSAVLLRSAVRDGTAVEPCEGLYAWRPHVPVQHGTDFVAHQYMIAGQSAGAADNPNETKAWGCDSATETTVAMIGPNGTTLPGVYPCFDYQTIADLLDAKGISWRYYAPSASGDDNGGGLSGRLMTLSGTFVLGLTGQATLFRRRPQC